MISFLLGSHNDVSIAELRTVFNTKESFISRGTAFFEELSAENVNKEFLNLGGCVKSQEIVQILENYTDEQDIFAAMQKDISNFPKKEYVLSLYGVNCDKKVLHRMLKDTLKGVKYDGNIREAQHIPSAAFHVLKRGGLEYSLVRLEKGVALLRTVAISDPNFWSFVDGDRPARDMEVGMLPSKLARIMVNLANVKKGDWIWDPFVGQGTVAMQASLVGVNTYGTDKARENLAKGEQNMKWLFSQNFNTKTEYEFEVQAIEQAHANRDISAIVTEPYLGKPHFKPYRDIVLAKREWKGIQHLYDALLKVAARTLKSGGTIVFILPQYAFLDGNEKRWYNPPLTISSDIWKVPELISDLKDISWMQKDSVVGRNLVILEKR